MLSIGDCILVPGIFLLLMQLITMTYTLIWMVSDSIYLSKETPHCPIEKFTESNCNYFLVTVRTKRTLYSYQYLRNLDSWRITVLVIGITDSQGNNQ